MLFNYSDELELLTPEVTTLMERSCEIAFRAETGIECAPVEIGVTIVDAEEIRAINNEFRGIDRATDVLSFPQYADAEDIAWELEEIDEEILEDGFNLPIGDVVICYDQALRQAEEYGTGKDRELIYLFVHSIFHLLGYDHMEEDEKRAMREREEYVMKEINLPRRED